MKKLIIHIDDVGMSYASNLAAQHLLECGGASSCSLLLPAMWSYDFIEWNSKKGFDSGVHFTLTSEWTANRWRPLTSKSTLTDSMGFYHSSNDDVMKNASTYDVCAELTAQVNLAIQWGMQFTHLDRHMYTVSLKPEWHEFCLALSEKNHVPLNIHEWELSKSAHLAARQYEPIRFTAGFGDTQEYNTMKAHLLDDLLRCGDGVTLITSHAIIETQEVKFIIPTWKARYAEYCILSDVDVMATIKDMGFILTKYSDI